MSQSFGFQRGKLIIPPVEIFHNIYYNPIMALDTGARVTVITPKLAEEMGINLDGIEPTVKLVGVAGSALAVEVTLDKVSILDLSVENVMAVCHPLPPGLGLDGASSDLTFSSISISPSTTIPRPSP